MYLIAYQPDKTIMEGSYALYSSDSEDEVREYLNKLNYGEFRTVVVIQGESLNPKRGIFMKPKGNDETAS